MTSDAPGGTILKIGIVMRPHGLRGAFTIKPLSPGPPPDFLPQIHLQIPGSEETITVPVRTWKSASSGHWIVESPDFTLERVQTIRNAVVLAPAEDYGPLDEDEVWVEDLFGATAVRPDGSVRGRVTGVLETAAPYPVLVLTDPQGQESYLPLPSEHFISFDEDSMVLVVSTPES
jgi:ribosomal 30S subunit maturation factor RimM